MVRTGARAAAEDSPSRRGRLHWRCAPPTVWMECGADPDTVGAAAPGIVAISRTETGCQRSASSAASTWDCDQPAAGDREPGISFWPVAPMSTTCGGITARAGQTVPGRCVAEGWRRALISAARPESARCSVAVVHRPLPGWSGRRSRTAPRSRERRTPAGRARRARRPAHAGGPARRDRPAADRRHGGGRRRRRGRADDAGADDAADAGAPPRLRGRAGAPARAVRRCRSPRPARRRRAAARGAAGRRPGPAARRPARATDEISVLMSVPRFCGTPLRRPPARPGFTRPRVLPRAPSAARGQGSIRAMTGRALPEDNRERYVTALQFPVRTRQN